MYGTGSGNWYRFNRKTTVEESLVVSMQSFRGRLFHGAAGTFTWTSVRGSESSIGYVVDVREIPPIVTLTYRWRDSENVRMPVRLQATPTQFGGRRWWFTCPLIVRGVPCIRRVGKLYLPPGARYFGCRTCHDLTYRSCQEAHRDERLIAHVAAELGCDVQCVRQLAADMRERAARRAMSGN